MQGFYYTAMVFVADVRRAINMHLPALESVLGCCCTKMAHQVMQGGAATDGRKKQKREVFGLTNTNIEKRLELAREARYKRLVAGGVPTTGDAIIGSLDALPDVSAQIEQVKFWAAQRLKPNDMLGYMRKEVAMFWVNGPQKK